MTQWGRRPRWADEIGIPLHVLAAIPSPDFNHIELGPFTLRAYGLMIALGVLAAVWLAQRRWAGRGGDPDDISAIAMWAVPAGLVGARLYHVVTDNQRYRGRWLDAFAIWEGGLGIPGGIAAGVLVGLWVARRRGLPLPTILDVVAPALPLAQAIGRWGNWFNQELYGRPTDLPWAVEIDPMHRPDALADVVTYHPTFLYESVWNLALVGVLLWLDRHARLRPGRLFAVYVAGYAAGRLWVEALRIDPANEILGLRVNLWMSGLALVAAGAFLLLWPRRAPEPVDAPGGSPGTPHTSVDETPPATGSGAVAAPVTRDGDSTK